MLPPNYINNTIAINSTMHTSKANARPNYRIYDRTGGGVTEDIDADSLEDAIEQGRDWIEAGDWSVANDAHDDSDEMARVRSISLECEVGEIVYRPAEPVLSDALIGTLRADPTWAEGAWQVCVSARALVDLTAQLVRETGGDWHPAETDEDGDIWLRWTPAVDVAMEEDEEATRGADCHDCSGTHTDREPDCPVAEGWDFVGTDTAGMDDFGCHAHGGTRMTHCEVCRNTGVYRDTSSPGCQRNPDEPTDVVTYRERDEASEAYIVEHHTDDGFLPSWLAEYLDRPISTRMTEEQAREWVADHTDEDELAHDDLEHAFAALLGRRATDEERTEGLWSHLVAASS